MRIASGRDAVLITVAVAVVIAAGVIFWSGGGADGGGNPDFPEGHPYTCADCGALTVLSDSELFALKRKARESDSLEAGRVLCAECGSGRMEPAIGCPHCGAYFPLPGPGRIACPHCGKPIP